MWALLRRRLAAASAQTPVEDYNDFEIAALLGYMAGGEFEDPATNTDRDIDEDNNFGVIFNAAVDEWRHYEVLYTQQSSQVDGTVPMDLDVQYLQVGGTAGAIPMLNA